MNLDGTNRRTKRNALCVLLVTLVLGHAYPVAAQSDEVTSVAKLLADPSAYAGEEISVEGELVGDYGFRDDGWMWTQLNDDPYARDALVDGGPLSGPNVGIGVRMPTGLGEDLDPVGGYRLEGPLVRLTGTWRYHDASRGGESYLDVTAFVLIERGRRLQEGPDWLVFVAGSLLLSISLGMWRRRRSDITSA